jgi:hypothetical protein
MDPAMMSHVAGDGADRGTESWLRRAVRLICCAPSADHSFVARQMPSGVSIACIEISLTPVFDDDAASGGLYETVHVAETDQPWVCGRR